KVTFPMTSAIRIFVEFASLQLTAEAIAIRRSRSSSRADGVITARRGTTTRATPSSFPASSRRLTTLHVRTSSSWLGAALLACRAVNSASTSRTIRSIMARSIGLSCKRAMSVFDSQNAPANRRGVAAHQLAGRLAVAGDDYPLPLAGAERIDRQQRVAV